MYITFSVNSINNWLLFCIFFIVFNSQKEFFTIILRSRLKDFDSFSHFPSQLPFKSEIVNISLHLDSHYMFLWPLLTGITSRNNVPNKRLVTGTFLCAVVGTLRSRFCVPDTVWDVPDIIWNILPNNIWHIFLISDLWSYYYQAFVLKLKSIWIH